ncbi:TPA: ferredoxin [Pseudomonas aeruginosa]|nr:ferredoxin [Pseudomonas aeruginosa]
MKIIVRRWACAGHARCNHVAPELFPLDDNGYVATDGFTVEPGQEERARRAARACPERIVEVIEELPAGP